MSDSTWPNNPRARRNAVDTVLSDEPARRFRQGDVRHSTAVDYDRMEKC